MKNILFKMKIKNIWTLSSFETFGHFHFLETVNMTQESEVTSEKMFRIICLQMHLGLKLI